MFNSVRHWFQAGEPARNYREMPGSANKKSTHHDMMIFTIWGLRQSLGFRPNAAGRVSFFPGLGEGLEPESNVDTATAFARFAARFWGFSGSQHASINN
jgi:hypothetical protein